MHEFNSMRFSLLLNPCGTFINILNGTNHFQVFTVATFGLQYFIPIILITSAYSLIVYDLKFKLQRYS